MVFQKGKKAENSDFVLLSQRPASLTHKNPQRRKIIHEMRPVERTIDRFEDFLVEYPVRAISVV